MAASRRTSSWATARMNCWRWRRAAFVEPGTHKSQSPDAPSVSMVQYFTPSYSLYPVLADIHGAVKNALPLNPDFSLPCLRELKLGGVWDFRAALDVRHHAERAERSRLPDQGTGRTLPRAKGRRGAGRSLRGFCGGERHGAGVEISARARGADVLEGVFAVLPARRLFCRPSGTHRRAAQDSGQLQRERPRPDCRRSHAGRFAVLPREFQKNHRHARAS